MKLRLCSKRALYNAQLIVLQASMNTYRTRAHLMPKITHLFK